LDQHRGDRNQVTLASATAAFDQRVNFLQGEGLIK
jgi:hypothetical protein